MNPEEPSTPNQSSPPLQPDTPPPVSPPSLTPAPSTPPSSKKTMSTKAKVWLIVGIAAAVVILLSIVLFLILHSRNTTPQSEALDPSIYHNREGYDPKSYQPTIGDPLAVSLSKTDAPFYSSKGAVVYACGVITLDNLKEQKEYPIANSAPTAITRTFIDGIGKVGVHTSASTLPDSGTDSNTCRYGLEAGGSIDINVFQPPFVTPELIQSEIARTYTPSDSIEGLKAYKYTRDIEGAHTYMLLSNSDAIEVRLDLQKNQSKEKELLSTAAKNFVALQKTPKGPALVKYDTPTFTETVARACEFIANDDILKLTGVGASVYAEEGIATGTGVEKNEAGTYYNYVQSSCSRSNTGLGSGLEAGPFNQKLDMTISSFKDEAGAKFYIGFTTKGQANSMPAQIGDEGVGYKDTSKQNTVIFRKGRFVVELTLNRAIQRDGLEDTATMTQKLTPFGQAVAYKLSLI